MNKQKMLIPSTSIPTGTDSGFNEITGNYTVSGKTMKVGDNIEAVISASQYSNGFFSCIGALKDV